MVVNGNDAVLEAVQKLSELALRTYEVNPGLVEEHANGERRIHQGGYGDRQLFELVQNAADELRDFEFRGGTIEAVLTKTHLYCANEGSAITPAGAETILRMGVSRKRGGQIGRFGVGVKSVLSVTKTPQFFSSTGAFGFDADWSANEIRTAVNKSLVEQGRPEMELPDTPVLRLARSLDVKAEREADPILNSLLEWATTVVRLPLLPGAADELAASMHKTKSNALSSVEEFPALFQLFSPHAGKVVLDDRHVKPAVRRELTVGHSGPVTIIHQTRSGSKPSDERYRVFTMQHSVTEEVRSTSGELHDRALLDVSWAVPDYRVEKSTEAPLWTVPSERGVFWSYFPTKYPTTLSGALNAAWKTNEDRQNLLDSADLNRELLDVAAQLVIDSLPDLVVDDDPAAYLALLPGRTRESPNWACKYLTGKVWELAATSPSLPDQDGTLQEPKAIRIRPEKVSYGTLSLWSEYTGRPSNWVHPSVDAAVLRRGKMAHILEAAPSCRPESVVAWLEALVQDGSAEASKAALRVLSRLLTHDLAGDPRLIADAKSARIVLTSRGKFVAPISGQIYRRTSDDVLQDDLVYIADTISDDPSMGSVLDQLGIREADSDGRFRSVLDQGFAGYTDTHWARFWELARVAGGASQSSTILAKYPAAAEVLEVRNVEGDFVVMSSCLLPGPVVPIDGSRDAEVTVDLTFHTDDVSLLRALGAKDRPEVGYQPSDEPWFIEYRAAQYERYCESLPGTSHRVQPHTLRTEGGAMAGPLQIFTSLSDEGRAKFIAATPPDGLVKNWTRQVGKNSNARVQIPSPIRWLFTRHGFVETSLGLRKTSQAVGPELKEYEEFLPVARLNPALADRLNLKSKPEDVPSQRWAALLNTVKESTDDAFIGRSYALLIRVAVDLLNEEPGVRCRVGSQWDFRPDDEVAVALNRTEFDELIRQQQPAILVDRPQDRVEAEFMLAEWEMRRFGDVIEKEVNRVPSGSATALADALPAFKTNPGERAIRSIAFQECDELEEITRTPSGTTREPLRSARDGDTVLIPAGLSTLDQMVAVDAELGFGLGRQRCEKLLAHYADLLKSEDFRNRLTAIRIEKSIPGKLALLLTAKQLQAGLPGGLIAREMTHSGKKITHTRIAELAFNAFDDGVLRQYATDICSDYQNAPARFDGGAKALKFVTDLGFPDSFAGARIPAPPQREEARGPVDFPALHVYQDVIARKFVEFLSTKKPSRAMLSLPTGAGKTRVAAEAVIRWIRQFGVPTGPVLWIAQTGELCEQAVQSWRFVWEHVGPEQNLVIDRLWNTNSATPVTGRPHLVVATDAKLASCLGSDEYEWLRQASLVIVDEAHVATSKEYTGILEQLGLTRSKTARHLVGLTATPFRNDENLTQRLAGRFGKKRLDDGILGDNPVGRLQDLGILSRVEHRKLPGAKLTLNKSELDEIARLKIDGVLPRSAERRLAEDENRNSKLLDEITKMPGDWPVLVFATSVDHAKVLAAGLNDRGIRSVAIDGTTPLADRRRSIDEFRNGKVRVITNFGVLSQGFDAPATRAVVIARPVYSRNIYQQMVGRGLRGVKNGGKDEVLILDVADNITNFDRKLIFNDFEHLWSGNES